MIQKVQSVELPALPGLVARESAEPGTLVELVAMAHRNGWNPVALALVIEAESGWNPKAGSSGGAQGLNQVIRSTRKLLKLPSDVRGWSTQKQLRRIVEPYFKRVLGQQQPEEIWRYYAANFVGSTAGQRGTPLRDARGELVPGNPAYDQNKELFDREQRGWIGPEHLEAVLEGRRRQAKGSLAVRLEPKRPSGWAFVGGAAAAVGLGLGIRWLAKRT